VARDIGGDLPRCSRRWGLATAEWREPASSDRLPSIGASLQPAIPRRVAPQQSPLPLHRSPTIVAQSRSGRGNQMHCSTSLQNPVQASVACLGEVTCGSIPDVVRPPPAFGCDAMARWSRPPPPGVSSLLCAPGVISILRVHSGVAKQASGKSSAALSPLVNSSGVCRRLGSSDCQRLFLVTRCVARIRRICNYCRLRRCNMNFCFLLVDFYSHRSHCHYQ
jgi:hypothetical protein